MNTFSHDDYLQKDDMGFSFHDEKDFIDGQEKNVANEVNVYEKRLLKLYDAIVPFLKNLQSNPDKPYINWPDRARKVQDFMKKLEKIYKGIE